MRLQSAIPLSSFQGDPDGFGDREERQERRRRRKRRRRGRRKERRGRRASRHRRRADRLDDERPRRRRRDREERRPRRRGRRKGGKPEPALQPAPRSLDEGLAPEWMDEESWEPSEYDQDPGVIDAEWEPVDDDVQWMGAATRQLPARWSPLVKMGPHFRIQASRGYRAAVIQVKPGLFLVAELPEQAARSEFGIAPVLAPMVVNAARRALQRRKQTPKEQRPLYRLMHREQGQAQAKDANGRPLARLFRVHRQQQPQAQPQAAQAQAAPQPPVLQPAPGSGQGAHTLLPVPQPGRWADAEDLAGLFGRDVWLEPLE